jgi:hypothetical protein
VATEYSGSPVLHVSITVLDDLDLKNAASVAVPLQQLQDSVMYLNGIVTGGLDFDFTDATFHGTTTFADGALQATVTSIGFQAVAISLTSTGDMDVTVADDLTMAVTDDLTMTVGGDVAMTASGSVTIAAPTGFTLTVGAGTFAVYGEPTFLNEVHFADTVIAAGLLQVTTNLTVPLGGQANLNGVATVADLRATVSNVAGLLFSGAGQPQYRYRELVDADVLSTLLYVGSAGGGSAEYFYINTLTVATEMRLGAGNPGNVIFISFWGAALAAPVDIKTFDGVTMLLAACSATVNTFSAWLCTGASQWRLLFAVAP